MSIDVMKQALAALEALWQIIDDIDTASDMAKDNDVWYRERVQHLQQKRSCSSQEEQSGSVCFHMVMKKTTWKVSAKLYSESGCKRNKLVIQ